jgi:hypothetical protein
VLWSAWPSFHSTAGRLVRARFRARSMTGSLSTKRRGIRSPQFVNARVDGRPRGAPGRSRRFFHEAAGSRDRRGLLRVSHRYLVAGPIRAPSGFGLRTLSALLSPPLARSAATVDAAMAPFASLASPRSAWTGSGQAAPVVDGSYDFKSLSPTPTSHAILPADPRGSSAKYERSFALVFGASVGAASSSASFPRPFPLQAERASAASPPFPSRVARLGWRLLASAWRENPYLAAGEELPDDGRWFARTRRGLFGPRTFLPLGAIGRGAFGRRPPCSDGPFRVDRRCTLEVEDTRPSRHGLRGSVSALRSRGRLYRNRSRGPRTGLTSRDREAITPRGGGIYRDE